MSPGTPADRMRPLRISIEGLRSFRAEAKIDFGHRTQIAVIGDTGAGKSSILEAMTYALYAPDLGRRPVQAGTHERHVGHDARGAALPCGRPGVGRSRAWTGGRGRGDSGRPGPSWFASAPAERRWRKVEQVRQVNDRIEALIGLDSDAFLRTVVLPQGRFARLLVEDKPRDRTEILRQVWRTGDLEAAGEAVGRQLQEVRTLAGAPAGRGGTLAGRPAAAS